MSAYQDLTTNQVERLLNTPVTADDPEVATALCEQATDRGYGVYDEDGEIKLYSDEDYDG